MADSISLRGGTAIGASLQVSQAGQSASGSYTAPAVTTPASASLRFVQTAPVNTHAHGLQVGTVLAGSGARMYRHTGPKTYGMAVMATADHGSRIHADDAFFKDNSFQHGILVGGTADVYRVTNGVMSRVSSNPITGGNWAGWTFSLTTTGTSAAWTFPDVARDNFSYSFAVAAIDGDNLEGDKATASVLLADRRASAGTATANAGLARSAGGSLTAPTGFTAALDGTNGRTVNLAWDAVPGATGYAIYICWSGDAANIPAAPYIEAAGGARAGDLVILKNEITQPDPLSMLSNRWVYLANGYTYIMEISAGITSEMIINAEKTVEHRKFGPGDAAPAAEAGSWYSRSAITANSSATHRLIGSYVLGGSAEAGYYDPIRAGETYRFQVYLRASKTVNAELRASFQADTPITITPGWQLFEKEITLASDATSPMIWEVALDSASLDAALPVEIDIAAPQGFDPAVGVRRWSGDELARLPAAPMIRTHEWIKQAPYYYTADMLTDARTGGAFGDTLDTFFARCEQAGGIPWLQTEWVMTPEEHRDLLAYVCAPVGSGHPMALKRQAQGRTAPWSDAFPRILWEIGNEAWNTAKGFWATPGMVDAGTQGNVSAGAVYGHIARYLTDAMEADPHWSDKIEWVLGGMTNSATFGPDAIEAFAKPCRITDAMYNMHQANPKTLYATEGEPTYAQVATDVPGQMTGWLAADVARYQAAATRAGLTYGPGQDVQFSIYEAGPFVDSNYYSGLSGSQRNAQLVIESVTLHSRLGGTATLHTMCECLAQGAEAFAYFLFRSGYGFKSHAHAAQGGGTYPSYRLCSILHDRIGPCTVYRATTLRDEAVTIYDRHGNTGTSDKTFVYAFESQNTPGRWMLAVGNLDTAAAAELTICTPFRSHASARVWANTGDFREHNIHQPGLRWNDAFDGTVADPLSVAIDIQPQAVTIPDPGRIVIDEGVGADAGGLLPGNCLLIELEGVN